MEARDNRPRVFGSSTIRDMRDVRSALKFWLEQFGIEVLLSEFNDFDRRPDQGTFDSCFEAISSCDYFILLVGGSKGSDYANGISVTQQEYRVAEDLAQQGRIKLVVLARSEVLIALNELVQDESGNILSADRSVLGDPDFIRQFVAEIRATEVGRRGEDPSGKVWMYPFGNFEELADALRVNLRLYGTVRRKSLLENLGWELKELIMAFCRNENGLPDCGINDVDSLRPVLGGALAGPVSVLSLDHAQSGILLTYLILGIPLETRLQSIALQDAISSAEFLEFDRASEALVRGAGLNAMLELRREIESFRVTSKWGQQKLPEFEAQWNARRHIDISNVDLALVLTIPEVTQNILRRALSLLDYIDKGGTNYEHPELVATAPFTAETRARAEGERATQSDVDTWRGDPESKRLIGGA